MLRRRLDKNTETSARLKEEMDVEMQMRENEMLQKFVDEKEKRERNWQKIREFSARERDLDKPEKLVKKKKNQLEHRKLSSNINRIIPHNIYTKIKKEVKRVTFNEIDESSPEKLSIRRANVRTPSPPSTNTGTLENRITKLEEEQQEHTKFLKEIIRSLKER